MNSGTNTLVNNMAEVTNISPFGFWMLVNKKEYFISYGSREKAFQYE